jgi:hypothetical protein
MLFWLVPSLSAQLRPLPESEIAARLPLLKEVDFDRLDPQPAQGVFRRGGIAFVNTRVSGRGTNVVIRLSPQRHSSLVFSGAPRFVVLEVLADGGGPFALDVTDAEGQRYIVPGQRPASGTAFLGMDATYGVQRIELGTNSGPLGIATIFVHAVPAPTQLIARPIWSTQVNLVNLNWKYPTTGQLSFQVERSVGSRSNFVALATVPPTTNSFRDSDVTRGTNYFYRVRADHPSGESAYSNDASTQERHVIFRSIGAEDGTICENLEISNRGQDIFRDASGGDALLVGDLRGNQQCKAILSFDTSSLPDNARILSAVLRLRQGARAGNASSALGPLFVDISGGEGFGDSATLTASDFEAPPGASRVATFRLGQDGSRTARLNGAGLARINTTGGTQFRLYFASNDNDNLQADNVGFFSGEADNPGNRPVLEIMYRLRPAASRP